ncbi:hypothetical protein CPB83DRAFT_598986 [Crepidotus variabilis]|uniref:F-box domain-containing protein n=1 Tax=Crepidotus variabilis TaxID=179855 RepID=A0A9P6JL15_9AGAR|nr:hypothetical protein CPB83DRAFT_598986 [Crepidotus variabilis]
MAQFNSQFSSFLQTNFVPSTLIRNEISDFLDGPERALEVLNAEVTRAEQQLADAKQKRDGLQSSIQQHRWLLTSFRRLPDDMLREIFLWCLPVNKNAALTAIEAPLLLGRVCSRWRTIVYRTPRLWASLHVPCPIPPSPTNTSLHLTQRFRQVWDDFERKLAYHSAAVEAWLTRSGSLPLSLSFHPRESAPAQHERYVKIYLDIMLKFTDRWGDIQMTIPAGDHSSTLALLTPQSLPQLKHVDLKFACRLPHDKRWVSSGLLHAPNLRTIQFTFFPQPISAINIAWSNLTRLSIQDLNSPSRMKRISLKDAHHLLSHSPKLQYCFIKIIDINDSVSPSEEISLPDLDTLVLVEAAWNIGTLFESLKLPSLRKLCYHSSFAPSTTRSPLLTLLERSGSQLERLITDIFNFTLDDLLAAFKFTPSLTHFTNRVCLPSLSRDQSRLRSCLPVGPHLIRVFINLLTPGYLDMDNWPQLRFVEMRDIGNILDSDVLNLIHGRMDAASIPSTSCMDNGYASLEHVRIWFSKEMVNDIRPSFERYSGLKVELFYPTPRIISSGMFPARTGSLTRTTTPINIMDDFAP